MVGRGRRQERGRPVRQSLRVGVQQLWREAPASGSREGELYNLAEDPAERHNRAAEMGDKVAELKSLWETWNAEQAPPSAPREVRAEVRRNRGRK